jgi:hypothetical protein
VQPIAAGHDALASGRVQIMLTKNLVVARYRDGRIVRGTTMDISLQRPSFHVVEAGGAAATKVLFADLKAVFFVRSLTGYPERQDLRGFVDGPGRTKSGIKVVAKFADGELLCGYAQGWSADRDRFFVFPADPDSNNDRVLVFTSATVQVAAGQAAEALVFAEMRPSTR